MDYTPLEAAVAVSLYGYNFSPIWRARELHDHFEGDCANMTDLLDILSGPRLAFWATELAAPTAEIYLKHALDTYGDEARERLAANLQSSPPTS